MPDPCPTALRERAVRACENRFFDESAANLATGRSHARLSRGTELIESRPMDWGDNLTLVGAICVDRWLTLATSWGAMNTPRFIVSRTDATSSGRK